MSHTHRSIPPPAPGAEQRGDPGHQRLQWSVPVQPIRREWAPGADGTLAADSFFLILSNQNRWCNPPNKFASAQFKERASPAGGRGIVFG